MTENDLDVTNNEKNEEPELRDSMADDFRDPNFNLYDTGPGASLPIALQPANQSDDTTNREPCGIFLQKIPIDLLEVGVRNLCGKYGQVVNIKMLHYGDTCPWRNAIVMFATTEDAANCVRQINGSSTVMKASFKTETDLNRKDQSVDDNAVFKDPVPNRMKVTINAALSAPMNIDAYETESLLPIEGELEEENDEHDPLIEYYNQIENNQLLNPELQLNEITNGRANYRRSTATAARMRTQTSRGTLNTIKQEFVHNGIEMFGETGECKYCGNSTLTFCKGCKDFFCSVYCCKEFKKINLGCSCLNPTTIKVNAKLPSQNREGAIGRGGKIKVSRSASCSSSQSQLNVSVSSTESETDSPVKGRKRLQILQQSRGDVMSLSRMQINESPKRIELPSDNKLVAITSVVDHKTVYLRSMDTEDNERYLKFLNDVAEFSKTAKTLQKIPKKGDIVLAEFEGVYYRAIVARIKGDFVVVAFIEFGNLEKKSLSQLKELREDLKHVEQFTFKAHLSGLVADLKSDQCLIYLYKLVESCVPLKFIKKDDKATLSAKGVLCELIVNLTNESVNGEVERINNIKPDEKMAVEAVDILEGLEGENLTVTVLDNSTVGLGYITVAKSEHMQLINRMQKRIAEFCNDAYEGPHTPIEGHVCLGKCGDEWYRTVMVKSFANCNPQIMFLDFGNQNVVNIDNMRRMPMEFKYPCYGVYVKVADVPSEPSKTELETLMLKLAPGTNLHVLKVEEGEDKNQIIFIKDFM